MKKVKDLVFRADLVYVFPSIGALLLSHYIRAIRWKMMLDELGTKPGLTNVFLSVLVGYFLNLVFPRLGEVAKCSLLGKYEKMPVDKLIGTIVAERILDLVCLFIVIVLTIATQLDQLGAYANELIDKLVVKANQSANMVILFFSGYKGRAICYSKNREKKNVFGLHCPDMVLVFTQHKNRFL